jgi:hypothetical protein
MCQRPGRKLQIDHDHRHHPGPEGCRACVRGALCSPCNTALGLLGDNLATARRLVAYLERTSR